MKPKEGGTEKIKILLHQHFAAVNDRPPAHRKGGHRAKFPLSFFLLVLLLSMHSAHCTHFSNRR